VRVGSGSALYRTHTLVAHTQWPRLLRLWSTFDVCEGKSLKASSESPLLQGPQNTILETCRQA
jgi:hypothetical protein